MEKSLRQTLLDGFSVPSYDQWLELVEKQLKGASFDKKLVTKTTDGISIQPIYRKEDAKEQSCSIPGAFPFVRDARVTGNLQDGWQVAQEFIYPDPETFNLATLFDLNQGLTSISLVLDWASGWGIDPDNDQKEDTGKNGISLVNGSDLQKAFKSLNFEKTNLQINPRLSYLPFFALLIEHLDKQNIPRETLKGNLISDPLAELAANGGLSMSLEKAFDELAACISWSDKHTPSFKTLGINLGIYADAGAGATQELAAAFATGVEYLRQLAERGIDIETVSKNMVFNFSMSSDFFLNMAKIRAARTMWAKVIKTCEGSKEAQKMTIHARTSRYNKTRFDPYVNILRATTEAYSAILAGSDSICVTPFDEVFRLPDEVSRRISRNIQMVLKEECHGHRIIDPGGGAWFLEELTNQLAERSWKEFQEIEKQGGISQVLMEGKLQQEIAEVAECNKTDVGKRKQVIVGTNMYANKEEKPLAGQPFDYSGFQQKRKDEIFQYKSSQGITVTELDENIEIDGLLDATIDLAKQGATLGQLSQALAHTSEYFITTKALSNERLAADYEQLRQKAEAFKKANGDLPKVFLANIGPLKQHKARADFSTGFLEPGGFKVMGNDGFESAKEAAEATLASKAKIAVICSTDDTYPDLVPEFAKQVKSAQPDITLALAGYPKEHIDSFKEAGIDEFIHLKANNLSLLQMFHQKAGV